MRLFTAIELSDEARTAIAAVQNTVAAALSDRPRSLRLVRTEHLHLTLVFVGEVPEREGERDCRGHERGHPAGAVRDRVWRNRRVSSGRTAEDLLAWRSGRRQRGRSTARACRRASSCSRAGRRGEALSAASDAGAMARARAKREIANRTIGRSCRSSFCLGGHAV